MCPCRVFSIIIENIVSHFFLSLTTHDHLSVGRLTLLLFYFYSFNILFSPAPTRDARSHTLLGACHSLRALSKELCVYYTANNKRILCMVIKAQCWPATFGVPLFPQILPICPIVLDSRVVQALLVGCHEGSHRDNSSIFLKSSKIFSYNRSEKQWSKKLCWVQFFLYMATYTLFSFGNNCEKTLALRLYGPQWLEKKTSAELRSWKYFLVVVKRSMF